MTTERRSKPRLKALSEREEIEILKRKVAAIERTLNGRFGSLETKVGHVLEGVRVNVDCNGYIVKELQEARALRGQDESGPLKNAVARGDAWKSSLGGA